MDIRDHRGLKSAAANALAWTSSDPKKLILIHNGVSVAIAIILSLVDLLLSRQIDSTGGLGGIGMRSELETAQTVLMIAQVVVLLFWQIGYVYVAMKIARQEEVSAGSLLQGFRKFRPVLSLRLITMMMYGGAMFLSVYAASLLFSLTPWSAPLQEAINVGTEEAIMAAAESCIVPLAAIFTVAAAILVLPMYYKLRMAEYTLLDAPEQGARVAIMKSRILMHGNRLKLFRLDLSFWWFYGLEALISAVAYGDVLLPMLGIELPWSATVSFYVFLLLCYAGQMALYWWRGNEVYVTYAMAYEALVPKAQPEEQ